MRDGFSRNRFQIQAEAGTTAVWFESETFDSSIWPITMERCSSGAPLGGPQTETFLPGSY
jgi:hypothetical protein